MIANIPLLDNVRIAAPCHADWNEMEPVQGERIRFCGQCARNVYNLSEMTRREAEDLVRSQEGRLCVRYYLRSDGTMLTKNCPVGVRNTRRLFLMRSGGVVALLALAIDLALTRQPEPPTTNSIAVTPTVEVTKTPVMSTPVTGGMPAPPRPTMGKPVIKTPEPLMGDIAPVTPPKPEPMPTMGIMAPLPVHKPAPTRSGDERDLN